MVAKAKNKAVQAPSKQRLHAAALAAIDHIRVIDAVLSLHGRDELLPDSVPTLPADIAAITQEQWEARSACSKLRSLAEAGIRPFVELGDAVTAADVALQAERGDFGMQERPAWPESVRKPLRAYCKAKNDTDRERLQRQLHDAADAWHERMAKECEARKDEIQHAIARRNAAEGALRRAWWKDTGKPRTQDLRDELAREHAAVRHLLGRTGGFDADGQYAAASAIGALLRVIDERYLRTDDVFDVRITSGLDRLLIEIEGEIGDRVRESAPNVEAEPAPARKPKREKPDVNVLGEQDKIRARRLLILDRLPADAMALLAAVEGAGLGRDGDPDNSTVTKDMTAMREAGAVHATKQERTEAGNRVLSTNRAELDKARQLRS